MPSWQSGIHRQHRICANHPRVGAAFKIRNLSVRPACKYAFHILQQGYSFISSRKMPHSVHSSAPNLVKVDPKLKRFHAQGARSPVCNTWFRLMECRRT
jgi:hypothetical protein